MSLHAIRQCCQTSGSLLAAALVLGLSGCSMCCAPFDYDYPYSGGAWVRDNPTSGRVGSVFDPAGYKAIDDQAVSPNQPVMPEGIEDPPPADDPTPEVMPPTDRTNGPQAINAPRLRLRPVRNYLPEN